jgi:D-3-phosphoglycerate dehydrogenase / 2-oxoglutarate reductase
MNQTILVTTSSFGKNDESPVQQLLKAGFTPHFNPHGRKLTESEVSELLNDVNPIGMIAGVEPLTRGVLNNTQELRVISRCGIGMDSVDLQAADELGIKVINTPDGPTVSVAELTMGMLLSILRKIHVADQSIRKGDWVRPMGSLLKGKKVGIIGCGRVGSKLASFLQPFECEISGFDIASPSLPNCKMVELDVLLAESDIVSLHVPGSIDGEYLINKNAIQKMKSGVVLINTARGDLIDEQALINGLESGHVSGAALDVFAQEPYQGPLIAFDDVLMTSHIGSYAREGRVMMELQAVDNLIACISMPRS